MEGNEEGCLHGVLPPVEQYNIREGRCSARRASDMPAGIAPLSVIVGLCFNKTCSQLTLWELATFFIVSRICYGRNGAPHSGRSGWMPMLARLGGMLGPWPLVSLRCQGPGLRGVLRFWACWVPGLLGP